VSFINGAIRTSEQEHVAKLLRQKSGLVVAFGSCATMGGIPALANLTSRAAIMKRSYLASPTVVNQEGVVPTECSTVDSFALHLPTLYDTVHKLDDVIDVDYYLPGCPPTPKVLAAAVGAILAGTLPAKGAVLLPDRTLCVSCNRNDSKPDTLTITEITRIHQKIADPKICFLAQGIMCMGPATRDGCDYPCVQGNMPCTGCFGPVKGADQGGRMVSALGGVIDAGESAMPAFAGGIADPAGTFYRYSLSASLLGSKREGT
jgi:F420-non-reducing hydrogenase small subunit